MTTPHNQGAVGDARKRDGHVSHHDPATAALIDRARAEGAAAALEEAADEWPLGTCAHRCFRTDHHVAPKDCLYGPDWLHARVRALRDEGDTAAGGDER